MSVLGTIRNLNNYRPHRSLRLVRSGRVKILKSIRMSNFEKNMSMAAEALDLDYRTDQELTVFTKLDYEIFYKTKLKDDQEIGYRQDSRY